MRGGISLGQRWTPAHPHKGLSNDPLTTGLMNAAWGNPLRDINGRLPLSIPSNRPPLGPFMSSGGNGSHNTSMHAWPARNLVTTNTPCTLFAVIFLTSTSQRGVVVGIGDVLNSDTGLTLGVGNTAPDAAGNNVVGVRGGVNYDQSGAAIGTGLHSIAKTTDGSSNEAWFVDGLRVSTTGTGASFNVSTPPSRFIMMQHGGSSSLGPSAGVYTIFGAAWNRVLRDGEIRKMHENPWRIARA